MNSSNKGKRAEQELTAILREQGFGARRGQQDRGADAAALPGVHITCKQVERLNLGAAMEQAARDARPGEVPVVMHRRSGKPWLATMLLTDFLEARKLCEETMHDQIRAGQFVRIARGPDDYPRCLGGKTLEERDEAQRRVPAQGVVVFVSRRAPWATVLLYGTRGGAPRPLYRESFRLAQLRAAEPGPGPAP